MLCAMEKIGSQDVGVSLIVEETPTYPHSEDKNPSTNCKIVSCHRKGGGDLGTPTNAFITRTVVISTRPNARENPVPFAPGSNLEKEWPSTAVVNDGSDGTMVDGPNYSIKKNNGGSSRRGTGKGNGSSKGRGKRKGMHNFFDT